MRTDDPDPAEREQLIADDLELAEHLEEYHAVPAGRARDRFWAQLGPVAACRLNTAIGLYEALASPSNPNQRELTSCLSTTPAYACCTATKPMSSASTSSRCAAPCGQRPGRPH